MTVTINGKQEIFDKDITLNEFLNDKRINRNTVVIEYNMEILDSDNDITFKDGDNIEILRIVGGGQELINVH